MQRITQFGVVFLFLASVAGFGITTQVDLRILDLQFSALRRWFPRLLSAQPVVIGIDEATTRAFSEPIALWHRHLGGFLHAMTLAKPAVVGIDLVLPDRGYESAFPGTDSVLTKGLAEARQAFPIVLALTVDAGGHARTVYSPFVHAVGPDGMGYALFPTDGDSEIRRFDERLGTKGQTIRTFTGQLARALHAAPRPGYIDYSRGDKFAYLPLQEVLAWQTAGDTARLEQVFRNKPVLLGVVLPFTDRHVAPVPLAAWETDGNEVPGLLLNAQALANILDHGLLEPVPNAIVIVGSVAALGIGFLPVSIGAFIVAVFGVALAAVLFATWLITQGWVFPLGPILLSALLAVGLRIALDTRKKLRERRQLRKSFAGYVSPVVMEEILAGHIPPNLGGVKKYVCVMFSDIRGYTARGERMSPEEVIGFLNRYFEHVIDLIHARGGTVVSLMGDGVMAVFGAPKSLDNPCQEAFEAGRDILRHVVQLNAQPEVKGEVPIEIGIGLNVGEALVGHVGSAARHEYSAIGDVTNVAARLQGLSAERGYRMLVSKAVADRLDGVEGLVSLGPVALKGHSAVEVFGYDERMGGAIVAA